MLGWLLLAALFCFSIIWLRSIKTPPENKTISVAKLLETANNGDLLFFSGDTIGERAIKVYTGSCYTHVAFVFRDLDEDLNPPTEVAFIWEADLGQGYRDGARVMRLSDKLKRWKGHPVIGWRKSKNRPDKQSILKFINQNIKSEMDSSMLTWAFPFLKQPNKVFCSELVALTLQDLGLMDGGTRPSSFSPKDFAEIDGYKEIVNVRI
jgi:hypothetical protein